MQHQVILPIHSTAASWWWALVQVRWLLRGWGELPAKMIIAKNLYISMYSN